MKPRIVLHVLGRMQTGGVERRLLDVMKYIDRSTWQVHVLALSGLPGELDDDVRRLGGEVHHIRLDARFPLRFLCFLRRNRVDVVHSHVLFSSGAILRLAALGGVPVRIAHFRSTGHGKANTFRRRMSQRLLKHWLERYAHRIVGVCEGVFDENWGRDWRMDERFSVIYNGFDLLAGTDSDARNRIRDELKLSAGTQLICHVGRITAAKNQVRLVDIFKKIIDVNSNARLLLVGPEADHTADHIRTRADSLGISEKIMFLGHRTDVLEIMRASDAMVYPSIREGLPGTVIEAMAVGLPTIATDLPGVKEITRYFDYLYVRSLNDSDESWAEHAINILASPPNHSSKQIATMFSESPFTIDKNVSALEHLYRDLLKQASSDLVE